MTTTTSSVITYDSIGYSLSTSQFSQIVDPTPAPIEAKVRMKKRRFSPPSLPLLPPTTNQLEESREQHINSAQICPRPYSPENEAIRGMSLVVSPHLLPEPETTDDRKFAKVTITRLSSPEVGYVSVHKLNTELEADFTALSPGEGDEVEPSLQTNDTHCTSPLSPSPQTFTCTSEDTQANNTTQTAEIEECDLQSRDDCHSPDSDDHHLSAQVVDDSHFVLNPCSKETKNDMFPNSNYNTLSSSAPTSSHFSYHRPLSRQNCMPVHHKGGNLGSLSVPLEMDSTHYSYSDHQTESTTSPPPAATQSGFQNVHDGGVAILSPESGQPHFIGKTRPVPPPKSLYLHDEDSPLSQSYSPTKQGTITTPTHQSSQRHHHSRLLHSTVSSPELFSSRQLSNTASFLRCKAGEDRGQFRADYLGARDVDSFVNSVNSVAKQLIDQRPIEVIAYVSSEKVRLAPPRNQSVLFKSFAIKDVLSVQRCTKNKRIIGIVIWRSKTTTPTCHILRCPDNMVSNTFYDAVSFQTQLVDDITQNKTNQHSSPSTTTIASHTPDDTNLPSTESDPLTLPRATPTSPATDVLHKFPAIHIGSTAAGKLHSINEVIQRVLSENKPSQSQEVSVWLSISQVQLVDVKIGREEIVEAHETSRIRAIGVYSQDKRFIGYIIKQEGKPLMGHVLRCNSAGLMVSLMSFLRQSCQLTSYQRGGSFYDELSTDDSDDWEQSEEQRSTEVSDGSGIVKRLRSFTMSLTGHSSTANSTPAARPSFQSHTQLNKKLSPVNDLPPRRRDSINTSPTIPSPLDFTDEDYAKFSVTFIGSATLNKPLTRHSILDALAAFNECGTAAGQAAITKNVIEMQVSALGIILSDKKHKLFVNRNYPRKHLVGFCQHPNDVNIFAFGSPKPGFPSSMKVHVFKRGTESTERILDAIKFWLEIEPTS